MTKTVFKLILSVLTTLVLFVTGIFLSKMIALTGYSGEIILGFLFVGVVAFIYQKLED